MCQISARLEYAFAFYSHTHTLTHARTHVRTHTQIVVDLFCKCYFVCVLFSGCMCFVLGQYLVRVRKPKNRYLQINLQTIVMCRGIGLIKKTLEWQQISSISSSENNTKYLVFDRFFTVVICIVIFWAKTLSQALRGCPLLLWSIGSLI